jgi:hypothetical protein
MAEPAGASTVDRRERFDNRTRFFLARWDEVKRLGTGGDAAGAERICQELLQYPELVGRQRIFGERKRFGIY